MWVCIENGLEVVAEFFNYLASANATLGSPNAFFITFAVNVGMIVLELIEHRRTRRHGGKQTAWDRFWFGQVSHPRAAQAMHAHGPTHVLTHVRRRSGLVRRRARTTTPSTPRAISSSSISSSTLPFFPP